MFVLPLKFSDLLRSILEYPQQKHERLTDQRVIMKWLLAKSRNFSNLPAFLDRNVSSIVKVTWKGDANDCCALFWHQLS